MNTDKFKNQIKSILSLADSVLGDNKITQTLNDKKDEAQDKVEGFWDSLNDMITDIIQKRAHSPRTQTLKVKLLDHFQTEFPQYESSLASGFDIRACMEEPMTIKSGERGLVPTGLSFALPEGYELQVRPRSGLALKKGISVPNSPGTIDADYRGELKIILINHGTEDFEIAPGDRVAQVVMAPVVQAEFDIVTELDETPRGEDGFGSTGV